MDISPDKVAYLIIKAREFETRAEPWGDGSNSDPGMKESDVVTSAEDLRGGSDRGEIAQFISSLNEDEQVALVVLTWIGRGSYEPGDWKRAEATARHERVNKTEKYLLGIPLLPDYLEEGLEAMGYSIEELGDGLL